MEAIFFGNGFNRLDDNCPSWDSLLNEISTKRYVLSLEKTVPNIYTKIYF